ncbi:MAG: hypothetical protein JWR22_1353 [Herminiimonas sp.]|nr:hypothetical protein [Herminiimonas sp.]
MTVASLDFIKLLRPRFHKDLNVSGLSIKACIPLSFVAMHALSVLKTACHEALEEGDKALYYSVVDPTSVLELIETVEVFPAADEMEAISSLLDQLTDYVKRSPSSPERDDLVLLSRQIRGVVGI